MISGQTDQGNIRSRVVGENIVLTNEKTGQSVSVPMASSKAQLLEAKRQLREPDRWAGPTAAQGMVMVAGGTPAAAAPADPDPRPYVPTQPGAMQRERRQQLEEWQKRQEAKASEARDAETRQALTSIAAALQAQQPQSEQVAPINLDATYTRRLETALAVGAAKASGDAAAIEAAEQQQREAWANE